MAIPYILGFNVKPASISGLGEVTFTDGTNDVTPNQLQCEAYGYTYNRATGTCSTFRYNTNLNRSFSNLTNKTYGSANSTETGTNNTLIMGDNNTVKGFSRNGVVTGDGNEIENGINNAKISGVMGKAIRQGEDVLGGSSYGIGAGYTQSSKIQLNIKTTDATATKMEVQDITDSFITLQTNSILGFDIYLTKLETGGTAGTLTNFSYVEHKGAVRCDNAGVITIYSYSTTTIANDGVVGTMSVVDSTVGGVPSVSVQVTDRANVNNLWTATAYLHELRTNIPFE